MSSPRRSRMVSFRLSVEEYEALKGSCSQAGARTVSELARAAMHDLLGGHGAAQVNPSLERKVEQLSGRVTLLDRAVERLAQLIGERQ